MNNVINLTFRPDSAFLLGGVSIDPAYDAITALDNDLPYLTATAVKGALRMEFEAFARGVEEANGNQGPAKVCDLENEELEEGENIKFRGCGKCLSCILFGGGNEEGKLRFNAAFMDNGDTVLPEEVRKDVLKKGRREGVSISRTLGKAREGSYYSTQTFPDLRGTIEISFVTNIDILRELKPGEREFLEAFFAFIKQTGLSMGSGKSTGLGNFKLDVHIPEKFQLPPVFDMSNNQLELFEVTLETLEPLVLGGLKNQYIIDTLPYVPASTFGGSVGFAFSRNKVDDDILKALFKEQRRFSTFNFYIGTPYPKPASLRRPKGKDDEKNEQDIMLRDFILKRAIEGEESKFTDENIQKLFKELYKSNLRPVDVCKKPDTSYRVKIGIERELQRASEGLLYAMETIPKGKEFKGLVIGETWAVEALQEKLGELFIGGKRMRGYGRTKVIDVNRMDVNDLIIGNKAVNKQLQNMAEQYGVKLSKDERRFFTLDLLFDFSPPAGGTNGKTVGDHFKEMFFDGIDLEIVKAYIRTISQGGYDFKDKKQKPLKEKIGAGSTFLVSVPVAQENLFLERAGEMVLNSVRYNWDSTPLFMINNKTHIGVWRQP
jgi:CRISPR/Cas system CSM-associated protein Csm3 (group 7 of RAMP superfamily)